MQLPLERDFKYRQGEGGRPFYLQPARRKKNGGMLHCIISDGNLTNWR